MKTEILNDGTKIEKLDSGTIIVHNGKLEKPKPFRKIDKAIFIEGLFKKEIKQLEQWMRPDKMSQAGFLTKKESLLKVIEKDKITIAELGVTYDQIADGLNSILKTIKNTPRSDKNSEGCYEINVNNIPYHIKAVTYNGWQKCPFEKLDDYDEYMQGRSDCDYHITNQNDNRTVFMSQLHPHLIEYHHFFEGDTKYRLDPKQATKLLELK